MDHRIRQYCDQHCTRNTLHVFFHELEREHQYRNTQLQHVRKIVEGKNPAEHGGLGNRKIQYQSKQGTELPKKQQVVECFASGKYRYRQNKSIERAKVQRQILKRRIPDKQIKNDCCYAGKR